MKRLLVIPAILVPSCLTQPAPAQHDEVPPEWLVPGEILIKPTFTSAVDDIVDELEEIVGPGLVDVLRIEDQLGYYPISIPILPPTDEAVEMREVLDQAIEDGPAIWVEPNLVVGDVGGQTGSLWASGIGIDAHGHANQYATDILELGIGEQRSIGRGVLVAVVDTGIDPVPSDESGPGEGPSSSFRAGRGTSFAVGFAAGIASAVEQKITDVITHQVIPPPGNSRFRARMSGLVATQNVASVPVPGDTNGVACVDSGDPGLILASFDQPLQLSGLHLADVDGDFVVVPSDNGAFPARWEQCP